MSNYVRNGHFAFIREVVEAKSGYAAEELIHPPTNVHIHNLDEGCGLLNRMVKEGKKIKVFGDYDADGITGCSILGYFLKEHASVFNPSQDVYIPHREDGFGISETFVASVGHAENTCLITVDNGIAAVQAIARAKERGMTVIVIDHHLPNEDKVLPPADVIIDPNADDGRSGFNGFCGAGLAYRFCRRYAELYGGGFKDNELVALAAIGTVADVVPLVSENRDIVKRGIQAINDGLTTEGLSALVEMMGILPINETDIAFSIGPVINAVGRTGKVDIMTPYRLLSDSCTSLQRAEMAKKMINNNTYRKDREKVLMDDVEDIIVNQCLYGENPLVIPFPEAKEVPVGMVGILAGRLAEQMKVPAIVLTEKDGVFSGSMRTCGGVKCKELLDRASAHLLKHGGHDGAAGLSVKTEDLYFFKDDLFAAMEDTEFHDEESDTVYYDLEISQSEVADAIEELEKYAPYGEGNRAPVFKIKGFRLFPKAGNFYKKMGNNNTSIKFFGGKVEAVNFKPQITEKYDELGAPTLMDLYGSLNVNKYISVHTGLTETPQIEVIDFEKAFEKKENDLASALRARMASL